MKENLENSIKQSLENFELPYNGEAWSAMSARLDAASTPSGSPDALESAMKSSLEQQEYAYNPSAWSALKGKLDLAAGATAGAGIESAMKESLNQFEAPYNPSAWTALESKLTGGTGKWKWYVAASLLVATATASYFLFTDTSDETINESPRTAEVVSTQTQNTAEENQTNGSSVTNTDSETLENSDVVESNESSHTSSLEGTSSSHENHETSNIANEASNSGSGNEGNEGNEEAQNTNGNEGNSTGDETPTPNQEEEISFNMPTIDAVCQGESFRITNENEFPLIVLFPNGNEWSTRANSAATIHPSQAGTYKIGYADRSENFVQEGTFNVNNAPDADFEFVDLGEKYLNGLPTTEVKTLSPGVHHEWRYGKITSTGTEAYPHFFTKGNHEITLIVTGSNGCKSSVNKSVNVEEDYNLMAMTGFDPTDINPSNSTFIPYALKERDVEFTMIILDPNDGHLIYETSDASQGWDGIDRQTGQLVEFETSYIWKVTIANPAIGEKSEYAGVIIPLKRN